LTSGRRPADPEVIRRARERRRAGESLASIARDAGVYPSTVRAWCAADLAPAPAILASDPAAPPDSPDDLARDLAGVADVLDAAGGADLAVIVRRAIDALRAWGAADDLPDPATDMRAWVVAMIGRAQRSYERAEAARDAVAAQRYASVLERWGKTLKQIDERAQGGDAIMIPRAELEQRRAWLRETIESYTSEPPRCAVCDRKIRASWAGADDAD
jgi:hypothetical protein